MNIKKKKKQVLKLISAAISPVLKLRSPSFTHHGPTTEWSDIGVSSHSSQVRNKWRISKNIQKDTKTYKRYRTYKNTNKKTQLQDSKREYRNPLRKSNVSSLLCCLKEADKRSVSAKILIWSQVSSDENDQNLYMEIFKCRRTAQTCYCLDKCGKHQCLVWISYIHTAKLTRTHNLLKSWNNVKTNEYLPQWW